MITSTTIANSTITANRNTVKTIVADRTPVYRVVARNHVVYDRKDYVLSAQTATIQVPITGGTLTLTGIYSKYSGYNTSGQRVVNADIGYTYSPASFPSNAYNETARTGQVIIMQEDSELQLAMNYNQPADSHDQGTPVCTSMTITIVDVPVIPASGGSVNSCDISVQANGYLDYEWASGGHSVGPNTSWTLSSSDYTVAWTGVTAQSKGTTISHSQTVAGTLSMLVTYTGDTSITATKTATVYQAKNEIRGYTDYEYTILVGTNVTGTYTSAGGNVDVEYTAQKSRKPVYDSNASGATITTDAAASLTTTIGTISPTGVTGIGTSYLTVPANNTQLRTITITLTSTDDATKTATTSFNQYASSAVYAYAYLSNYTGNGIITDWEDVKQVSQNISNWSSPSQNVYQVSADGDVKYRLGQTAAAQMVARDTYFYNVDNQLFHTRVVLTAGSAGNEYLYYKNNNWNFGMVGGGTDISASTASFQITGTTNTKYYVTVKRGSTTVMSKTLYTGQTLTVNCGQNTSTSSTRTFTISFEEYNPSAVNKPDMLSIDIIQAKKVPNSISVDINEWTICTHTIPGARANFVVASVGGGWNASYDSRYFTVSPASGSEGDTRVTVTAIAQGPEGITVDFVHSILSVGRARVDIIYDTSC